MHDNFEQQELDLRHRLPEMNISELETLLKSYKNYNHKGIDDKTSEVIWVYQESIELIEQELRERTGIKS